MNTQDTIVKGISAHGLWKQRILDAIDTGKSEWSPSTVCQDNNCEFGKWLLSCSAEEKSSPHYNNIKGLHSDFHKIAANVLDQALTGKKTEANEAINMGGKYRSISGALTKEMMNWKTSLS